MYSLLLFEKSLICGKLAVSVQGVSYSQKFYGKCSFPNLANGRTFQFMFPKYLVEYQNIKMKSKFKSEKSKTKKNNNIKAMYF